MKKLLICGLALLLYFICLFAFDHHPAKTVAAAAEPQSKRPAIEPTREYNTDELTLLTTACGKPTTDKLTNATAYGGANAKRRALIYSKNNTEFWFLKNSVDASEWTFVGAFNAHGDDAAFTPEELHQRMPCTEKVTFHPSALP